MSKFLYASPAGSGFDIKEDQHKIDSFEKIFKMGFCYPDQFSFSLLSADPNDKLFKTNSAQMKTTYFLVSGIW